MGVDRGDVEGPGGVSPLGVQIDHGGDDKTCGRRGVGISPGSGGTRRSGIIPHTGVNSATSGDHRGTGGVPPYL